ncbi:hypothetical protein LPC_1893 [Legionella pneumophila str. Corby]|nr:hypothetical protein LPC_1893 [Legionella pneumophila str. Corby]CZI77001.1 Uncharacterised protein [Legionella pneumophila]
MKLDFFNVVWQSLKKWESKKKKGRISWRLIKLLINTSVLAYKLLKFICKMIDGS